MVTSHSILAPQKTFINPLNKHEVRRMQVQGVFLLIIIPECQEIQ